MKNKIILFIITFLLINCHSPKKISNEQVHLNAADEKIFTDVQHQTFRYFFDGAEPVSGLGRERFHVDNIYPQNDKNVVTSGGAGFGVMALLVGIERGFITREEGRKQLEKIVTFLET